jgi:hypothetical protein
VNYIRFARHVNPPIEYNSAIMTTDDDDFLPMPSQRPDDSGPPRIWLIVALAAVVVLLALLVGITLTALKNGESLPEVTIPIVDAAAAKWIDKGPPDYDLDIQQTGVNAGAIHVEVRKHDVTVMTLNGRPTDQHLWDYWSVTGLFGVIRRDVEACMPKLNEEAQEKDPTGQAPPIVPRGTFDAIDGHPLQYHRITPSGADVKWDVTKFEPR